MMPYLKIKSEAWFMNDEESFRGFLSIVESLVLLLNDEQPDIRYYLCESGLTNMLDTQEWTLHDDV